MLPEDQKRILGYFIEEAKDHLNTIEQGLLNLQSTIEDPEMVNEVFRAAHSVKGGAAMLGLNSIQLTAHRMEDFFKLMKESPPQTDRELESMLLQIFDGLQEQLELVQGPFGMTDEQAQEIITNLEPVFEQTESHLQELIAAAPVSASPTREPSPQPAVTTTTATVTEPHPETSALQLVFRSDIPALLRDMLTTFKQNDTAASRQELVRICQRLRSLGEQFELSTWCDLIEHAAQAVANPQQTYRTLAPILIKDIKQAQELVLTGNLGQVVKSQALLDLVPPPADITATEDDETLDALLAEALSDDTAEPDLADLFASAEADAAAITDLATESSWLDSVDSQDTTDTSFDEAFDELHAAAQDSNKSTARSHQGIGPEVGAEELNSLADLFEGEHAALEDVWEEETLTEPGIPEDMALTNEAGLDDDFADLFSAGSTSSPTKDDMDDMESLFGSTLDDLRADDQDPQAPINNSSLADDTNTLPSPSTIAEEPLTVNAGNGDGLDEFFNVSSSSTNPGAGTTTEDIDDFFEEPPTEIKSSEGSSGLPEPTVTTTGVTATNEPQPAATQAASELMFEDQPSTHAGSDTLATDIPPGPALENHGEVTVDNDSERDDSDTELDLDLDLDLLQADNLDAGPETMPELNLDLDFDSNPAGPDFLTEEEPRQSSEEGESLDAMFAALDEDEDGNTTSAPDEDLNLTAGMDLDFSDLDTDSLDLDTEALDLSTDDLNDLDFEDADLDPDINDFEGDDLSTDDLFLGTDDPSPATATSNNDDLNSDELSLAFDDQPATADPSLETEVLDTSDLELDVAGMDTDDLDLDLAFEAESSFDEESNPDGADFIDFDLDLDSAESAIEESDHSFIASESEQEFPNADVDPFALNADPFALPDEAPTPDQDLALDDTLSSTSEVFQSAAPSLEPDTSDKVPSSLVAADQQADADLDSDLEIPQEDDLPEVTDTTASDDEFDDFADLDDLLSGAEELVNDTAGALPTNFAETASSDNAFADSNNDSFGDLESLLEDDIAFSSEANNGTQTSAASSEARFTSDDIDDDFGDLEKLLEETDQLGGSSATVSSRRTSPSAASRRLPRRSAVLTDQTMRVSVSHLDNLSNLVGELVVNRNSLEQDQERLRQFLDNLLLQVQQLNDVGQRLRDLYERSLLESSLISNRQAFARGLSSKNGGSTSHATGATFDALEMDRFTGFHTLSQEMIELIVRVREASSDIEFTIDSTDQIARQFRQVTTQLQEGLNKARMVPFAQTADRLPRAVRDISLKFGKEARLVVEGRDTLIDKMILERLYDPITHLVNNAITHGIESPEKRLALHKPREGTITVRAFYQGNQTVIYIADDGGGIHPEVVKEKALQKGIITPSEVNDLSEMEVYDLLFLPGFSTRDQADDFSGRGVGMDVVRTALADIRGTVTIESEPGKGTSFTIRLPLTLSITKALSCINNQGRIAFPMDGVEDMLDAPKDRIQTNEQGQTCILWRDSLLPFRPLSELLQFNRSLGRGRVYGGSQEEDVISIVVLRSASTFVGLQVDQVIGEQEIVIKQIEGPVPKPTGIAGATVLGDGRVMPIADVLELIDLAAGRVRREQTTSLWAQPEEDIFDTEAAEKSEPTVLIVDDSITVRELLSMSFNKVGYRVEQARDGQEAWEKLRSGLPCDLVFCDIEMPRMDGLELLSRLQKDAHLSQIPIAMLTSRGADRHRQMAVDLGAKGYFTKPYLEEMLLDAAQRMLKGENMVAQK
jgi:chemotaxis protein histidine kinase CheA/CheY-like chemotaxis protein